MEFEGQPNWLVTFLGIPKEIEVSVRPSLAGRMTKQSRCPQVLLWVRLQPDFLKSQAKA